MTTKEKPIWKEIVIKAPHCPRCGNQLDEVTDPDARTIMTYRCPKCFWCY